MHNSPVITIDGPSGVGKGTMAVMLAHKLGWHYLDSGAIYRLLALKVMCVEAKNFSPLPSAHFLPTELADIARNLDIHFKDSRTYLDNKDVTDEIRREEVGLMASKTSAFPEVRQALLERQRAFAQAPGLVTDGRDMGSVVFPDAIQKFYLDASPEIRAERRQEQLKAQGKSVRFADLLLDMQQRDQQDKSRQVSPLVVPKGAVVIDSGRLSKSQTFEKMLADVQESLKIGGVLA